MRLIESRHAPLSPATSDRHILQWPPPSPTLFSYLICVPSISSLLINQTDTMLTCSYSGTRTLCSASTSTTSSTNFDQSWASFSMMNVQCLLSLPYTVQRDGRIRHILGAATLNQGLLMSAEEKALQNPHHTHTSHCGLQFLWGCSSSRCLISPGRVWI